jgi:GGDEF domain-containing protein
MKVVRGWIWPSLFFLPLAVLLATFSADASWLVAATPLYPLVVYTAGFVLAWHFRRSRVAAVLLGLFMMDLLLRPSSSAFQPGVGSIWDASGVLFLFFMPVVAAMKDRGVSSRRGFIQVAIVLAGLASGLLFWAVRPELLSWTWQPFLPWDFSELGLSDAALVVGLFALLLTGGLAVARDHRLDKGFFFIAVALLLALRGGSETLESTVYLTMAGLILLVNVMEKLYSFSVRDEVTGLPTRRALRREIKRSGGAYALAFVGVDHYNDLYDRHGRETSDRVIKRIAMHLGKTSVTGPVFRYDNQQFAIVYSGRGREEVLGDLEMLRADIEDFRFSLRPKAHGNGQAGAAHYPAVRWSLTVTVGVAERGERKGWAARYRAIAREARGALHRGQKAGGNIVSK